MQAQWIIGGHDPVEVGKHDAYSLIFLHRSACRLQRVGDTRAGMHTNFNINARRYAYYTRVTQTLLSDLDIYSCCQIIELIQPGNNFTD